MSKANTPPDISKRVLEHFDRYMQQYPATFKIQHYMNEAQQQLKKTKDPERQKGLSAIVSACLSALQAAAAKDVDHLLEEYERIHRGREQFNLPFYKAAGVSAKQREIAQRERRPGLPKRAVMLAINGGCKTVSEVENFLFNNPELTDKYGDIGIDGFSNGFTITDWNRKTKDDPDECQAAELSLERIGKLLSEIRKA